MPMSDPRVLQLAEQLVAEHEQEQAAHDALRGIACRVRRTVLRATARNIASHARDDERQAAVSTRIDGLPDERITPALADAVADHWTRLFGTRENWRRPSVDEIRRALDEVALLLEVSA